MKTPTHSLLNRLLPPAWGRLATGLVSVCAAGLLLSCGSGGGGGGDLDSCDFTVSSQPQALTAAEVELLLARAAEASNKLGRNATIAVSDRVGNVLGVYRMGAASNVVIRSGRGISGGLEEVSVPSELAAIAKAITGAYLSSSGNAFSTRTASFIVQEHFAPGVNRTAAGPLFGVQFSQLPCGDFNRRGDDVGLGPKRSPLGLSADPGGFPIFKNGQVVGGIGVAADGVYGLDRDSTDFDNDVDERIAQSAVSAFAAPKCIRAERITLGGLTAPYSDSDDRLVAVSVGSLSDPAVSGTGTLVAVSGYIGTATVRAGTAYGEAASGYAPADGALAARGAYVLVNGPSVNRYPAAASIDPAVGAGKGMTAAEVSEILNQALGVANQARAQIRRPVGMPAQVTVSVVDAQGNILGLARTADAPIFGSDVAVQKARTAAFFSSVDAAAALRARPDGTYAVGGGMFSIADYLDGANGATSFFSRPGIFADGTAFSARAIGNISRPFYPDGIDGKPQGPFSKPFTSWSPFSVGLQLDLVYPSFLAAVLDPTDANLNCTGATGIPGLKNGIQIFPGSVPIYRDGILIGAIGVSGDGVDQDDMVALLGLARAGNSLNSGLGNAPDGVIRADELSTPQGSLRYAQCPQSPFNDGKKHDVCGGL